MNPAALFAAHKTAILGGAAAAVAGLALLSKRKKPTGVATTAGVTVPGTIPAAAIASGTGLGGSYDSSAFDAYNALQPELEQILQTVGSSTPKVPAPAPASPLFKDGFYAMAGGPANEAVYQYKDGQLDLIPNATALHQLGGGVKNINYVTKGDKIWSQPRS